MISGLCRKFSIKSKKEQDDLFKTLLDAPVMHMNGTTASVNGIIIMSSYAATA